MILATLTRIDTIVKYKWQVSANDSNYFGIANLYTDGHIVVNWTSAPPEDYDLGLQIESLVQEKLRKDESTNVA